MSFQTILGAGGAIGSPLARFLIDQNIPVKLVSRTAHAKVPGVEFQTADLLLKDQVLKATENSNIIYLTAGLTYKAKIWEEAWPKVMENILEACHIHGSKLVFIDNVYMIHPTSLNPITEDAIHGPVSRKGAVRDHLNKMIMQAVEDGKCQAIIARSADFLANAPTSLINQMIIQRMKERKVPQWFLSANYKHSFTWAEDAGKGLALLGNANDTWDRVWNLPTSSITPTVREWVNMVAKELSIETPSIQVMSKFSIQLLGLFIPILKEFKEMLYQYDRDYVFDSTQFNHRFQYTPATPEEAIRNILYQTQL